MELVYPAIFTPWESGPGYTVVVPDLPGCVTEGRDLNEAIEMGGGCCKRMDPGRDGGWECAPGSQ